MYIPQCINLKIDKIMKLGARICSVKTRYQGLSSVITILIFSSRHFSHLKVNLPQVKIDDINIGFYMVSGTIDCRLGWVCADFWAHTN